MNFWLKCGLGPLLSPHHFEFAFCGHSQCRIQGEISGGCKISRGALTSHPEIARCWRGENFWKLHRLIWKRAVLGQSCYILLLNWLHFSGGANFSQGGVPPPPAPPAGSGNAHSLIVHSTHTHPSPLLNSPLSSPFHLLPSSPLIYIDRDSR